MAHELLMRIVEINVMSSPFRTIMFSLNCLLEVSCGSIQISQCT